MSDSTARIGAAADYRGGFLRATRAHPVEVAGSKDQDPDRDDRRDPKKQQPGVGAEEAGLLRVRRVVDGERCTEGIEQREAINRREERFLFSKFAGEHASTTTCGGGFARSSIRAVPAGEQA